MGKCVYASVGFYFINFTHTYTPLPQGKVYMCCVKFIPIYNYVIDWIESIASL